MVSKVAKSKEMIKLFKVLKPNDLTPINHSNNWGLRQLLSLTTNFVTQNWARSCRGKPAFAFIFCKFVK